MIRLKFIFGTPGQGMMEVMVEGKDEREVIRQASFWGEVAAHCPGHPHVAFRHRTSQGFDFYELVDIDTGERLQFGQRKEDNGLFPKGWQPPYQSQVEQGPPPQPYQNAVVRQPARPNPPRPNPVQAQPQTVYAQPRPQAHRPPPPQPVYDEPPLEGPPF